MESFSGKKFPQDTFEIAALAQIMKAHGCRSYLEIGARYGDSFHYLASGGLSGGFALAVDMPGAAWGNSDSADYLSRAVGALGMRRGLRAQVIFGDSRAQETIDECERLGPFDAVFIDGDHSPDGVMADWQNYGPMARKLVAFHDIVADARSPHGRKFGVGKLWRSLKESYSHVEIIGRGSPMGIGVVFV